MSDFVHLHCHTEYSLLDGAIRLGDLCQKASEFNMPAVAITDHGNMYGAVYFYLMAKKAGLKPIIGCEVYVSHGDHTDKASEFAKRRYHLVLLAKNENGYKNLCKIVTEGCVNGFHYKPRVSKEVLREHSDDLIALSACLAGEVPRYLLNNGMEEAEEVAKEYAEIFPDRFYLELQSNGLKEQDELNDKLIELSKRTGLPLVATNDCHYLNASDVEAHDTLLCIQTGAKVQDEKRMRFDTTELYYKSPEEMKAAFAHVPEAISNTVKIADQIDIELTLGEYYFPEYDLPKGMTMAEEFSRMCREGLQKRIDVVPYEIDKKVYWDRLELELKVINDMGFPAYFLIVQDFINWAKDNGIPVGPGRGSAAGSIVAWALRITNLDPIPYDLLFERFLNVERVSMPDIDVDFCERRRGEVIRYTMEQYGEDKVAQITTFGKMKAKAVIKDVARAQGLTFQEGDKISKLIPDEMKMTIQKALAAEPELATLYRNDPSVTKLIDISLRLEGLCRHASTHAAGVVISDKPMVEYLPLYRDKKGGRVTQFDMKKVEEVGLVKFDFLGLRTMTVIQDAVDNIGLAGKPQPDLDTLPFDDEATYELYQRGDTDGIFQVESSGMRTYLRMLKPSCFDDIIAMLALYRPGPLNSGMVDEFIKRKHGEVPVVYPLPSLEDCLKPTYGVIVYQEQVMQIAQIVGNYTLGGADLLRRAMGKKIAEAMAQERTKFVAGAAENNIPKEKADEIFDLMEQFAAYGFNKSHSAAYALISYWTAYLKVHYPVEFMAALMTSEMGNQDKVLKYVAACRDMGVSVKQANVQASRRQFTVHNGEVIFGLGAIKTVGDEAIREIVEAREEDGEFQSMLDLACRVNLRKVTKRVLENLIKGGAMDCFGVSRRGMLAALDNVVAKAQKKAKDKDSNQVSLFTMISEEPKVIGGIGFDCEEQTLEEFDDEQKLRFEKDALGFYLTSHPLQPFRRELHRLHLQPLEEAADLEQGAEIKCAVLVTAMKEHITKKGSKMAFMDIEDLTASGELVVFPEAYTEGKELFQSEQPLLLTARISDQQNNEDSDDEDAVKEIKLLCEKVESLSEACQCNLEPTTIDIPHNKLCVQAIAELKEILVKHNGPVPVYVRAMISDSDAIFSLDEAYSIHPGPQFEKDYANWKGVVHG
ncbi:DNA polymerase III subunit alpha [Halodesulfovibrio marinisediminis]|uniref:DNA polymerase III subunit alpha n=1 Tax=Halodesulfovibrio marinisediminis DSM 17456 TaxID=1121457 RepID=A0A1N6DN70_9BACT|nr:DNA polymerase III subunit alpha [Halodesulfovibrio marinisediminis]SIN72113.1 DNA polymerase III, alpha subunit [Halodesulfovibrio marinisediminis DSM 17456]